MTTTLNNDEFAGDSRPDALEVAPEVHSIVYGATGWTDVLDDAALEALVKCEAVMLDRIVYGHGWTTMVYVSTEGRYPE